ncbi:tail fiber domain-containing protein [Janthinobacterium violaceinigrum]|uniref:Peptidase S74 domain-containing protein n=1 Tax=Janthinobacterium violaceinigrum TaxID=2654252 RepID=A0A6I1I8F9_9BURK|nr:tail fiber domain-containing protein [Janthinobacterium violaceinigrum]KAB8063707.1 hypothetical protein GCN75_16790 [Janthinobacterium violaceinigrum]
MSAIVGERDTLLQATAERFSTTSDGKAILMAASTPVFRVNSAGEGAPASIAVTAKPVNVTGDIVFSVSSGTALRVNGNVATVDFSSMTTDTALVQARIREFGVDYVANYMISKVFDGAAGETGLSGLNTGQAFAYKRAAAPPGDTPGGVIFNFAIAAITTPAGNDLANGWSKNIPPGTAPLYVRVAAASSRNATDSIAANEWAAAVQLAKDGVDGLNVISVPIYQRGATNIAPPLPTAVCTFTFATGKLAGLNNGWSTQVPSAGGAYLFMSSATAVSSAATDDIAPGEWAAAARLAADGAPGQRGTVTVTAPGYSAWSDASAVYELGRAGYGTPMNRDVVTLYDATHAVTKFYVDGAWMVLGTVLNGSLLVDGTVAAKAIVGDTLGAIKANLGSVVAGDLYGTTLHGGAGYPTNVFDWPPTASSGGGYHLSSQGLLLGNYKAGQYFTAYADGRIEAPGLVIKDGNAAFTGSITGSTITGGIFQTSASGRRLTLSASSNVLRAYAANGAEVVNLGERSGGGALEIDASAGEGLDAIRSIGGCFFNTGAGSFQIYSDSVIGFTMPRYTRAYDIVPGDGSANLGRSTHIGTAWRNIYSQTAVTIISDERDKEEIQDSDLGLDFILALRPVRYRMKIANTLLSKGAEMPGPYRPFADPVMHEEIRTPVRGVRNHYGFIAQEVRESLGNSDSAIWVQHDPSDPESQQALRYEELLAPIVGAVQELHSMTQSLRAEVAEVRQQLKGNP